MVLAIDVTQGSPSQIVHALYNVQHIAILQSLNIQQLPPLSLILAHTVPPGTFIVLQEGVPSHQAAV